jgi:hypothetical protein
VSTIDDGLRASVVHSVMTRIATEPRPTPYGAFVAAVRRGAPRDALGSVATAWHLATLRDRPIALGARVRAAGLALGVGGLLASSGAVALASVAGVAGEVAAHLSSPAQLEPERPAPASDEAAPRPVMVLPSDEPSSLAPSRPIEEPTPSPTAPQRPSRTPRPTDAVRGTDTGDDGHDATPRPTSDSGGGDSGGGDPGDTGARATQTPEPSDTPEGTTGSGSTGG